MIMFGVRVKIIACSDDARTARTSGKLLYSISLLVSAGRCSAVQVAGSCWTMLLVYAYCTAQVQ